MNQRKTAMWRAEILNLNSNQRFVGDNKWQLNIQRPWTKSFTARKYYERYDAKTSDRKKR